ncbi:nicotinamide riboside transporter PnuC [Leuconostocaceae bacterium ESL0958]|nr:nicotinamide riboside transporter PnuC [Leuconostocaceae bacterium ESL0958]
MKQYMRWLGQELRSLNTVGIVMLSFIVGVQMTLFLSGEINKLSVITLLATIVGSACTVYMMIGKPINGLLGMISALGFIYVNWNAGHYASVLEQLIFIALIDLPLLLTWKTWGHRIENGVRSLTETGWLVTIGFMFSAWIPMIFVYKGLGDTNPFWDSLSLVIMATASIYVYAGFGDSYSFWLMADVVNIALWLTALNDGYSASSLPMLLTMLFYLITALYGRFFSVWSRS